ncbi:hypothetical protein BCY84_09870 [Trypanosoma cruzi cruzi]|nr:hypothetical protein BCY84_09870 [Trypanosoma cruzi cruzi]
MLQCSLMFLVHSVLATAAFRGNENERCIENASRLSSPVRMLHGVWRYCSEMPNHHARGRGTEWKTSLCVSAAVGVGAAASDLSARWLQRVAATLFSWEICCHVFTCVLLRGQCAGGCAIAEWRERSGGNCVSAAVRSRAGCLAAEGIAHPTQRRSCLAPSLSLSAASYSTPAARSEAADAAIATSATERGHVCCCVLRGHTVWHSGVPKNFSRSLHTTPGTGRGVFASWRTLRLSPLFSAGGRTPEFLLFPTQADGCAMAPQRGSCFHHGGATSAGLRIGNMNDECIKKGSVMVLLCCANCGNIP